MTWLPNLLHLLHLANRDLWAPIWPNVFAPNAGAVGAVAVAHVRATRQRARAARISADLYEHLTGRRHPAAPGGDGSEAP